MRATFKDLVPPRKRFLLQKQRQKKGARQNDCLPLDEDWCEKYEFTKLSVGIFQSESTASLIVDEIAAGALIVCDRDDGLMK